MRIARSTGAFSGLVITVLGLWGALIPFIGPYFDYSFGVDSTWHYTSDRLWLCILPGAVAVLGGLLLLGAGTRPGLAFGGWLAILAGAWFVIGPAVSLTWETGPGPIGNPLYDSTRQMFELVGYFYGLGALIVALGAFASGRLAPPRRIREALPPDRRAARVRKASAASATPPAAATSTAGGQDARPAAQPETGPSAGETSEGEARRGVGRAHFRFPRRRHQTRI